MDAVGRARRSNHAAKIQHGIRYARAAALTALSATGAHADEWCGYATHDNAVIQCGYTTVAECETAVGKGGMCFVDPDTALNTKRRDAGQCDERFPAKG